jgi:transketolase
VVRRRAPALPRRGPATGGDARVSVEAGAAQGWWRYLGSHGEAVSVEDFGASGDGQEVLAACGVTVEAVVAAALRSLARATGAARTAHAEPTVAARTD